MKNIKYYFKGFTLVELIIVITILTILATIAFISFQNYSGDARDANRISTLKNIETGLELFTLKTSQFPTPDNPKIYTGGLEGKSQLNQGIIGENVAKIISLSNIPLDPKDETNYVYSTFGNSNKYYQIGINSENIQLSFIPQTYANSKTSIVKGNYRFDPSLPSLIMVENEALVNSGIFSPDVCFVMNKGKNTLDECNEIKSEMILKDYDNSLVGYWDMETLTGNLLKDLSGNENNGIFTGTILPTSTGGLLGNSLLFSGSGTIHINDIGGEKIKNKIINQMTISIILKSNSNTSNEVRKLLSITESGGFVFGSNWTYNVKVNSYLNDCGPTYFCFGVGQKQGSNNYYKILTYKENLFYEKYINITGTFLNGDLSFYVDGVRIGDIKGEDSLIEYSDYNIPLCIGSEPNSKNCLSQYFKGIIDDVKIYNRALSPEEIFQQAKIAGF